MPLGEFLTIKKFYCKKEYLLKIMQKKVFPFGPREKG